MASGTEFAVFLHTIFIDSVTDCDKPNHYFAMWLKFWKGAKNGKEGGELAKISAIKNWKRNMS